MPKAFDLTGRRRQAPGQALPVGRPVESRDGQERRAQQRIGLRQPHERLGVGEPSAGPHGVPRTGRCGCGEAIDRRSVQRRSAGNRRVLQLVQVAPAGSEIGDPLDRAGGEGGVTMGPGQDTHERGLVVEDERRHTEDLVLGN